MQRSEAGGTDGDGRPDPAVANNGSNAVSVLLGNGNGSFGTKTDFATGSGPYSIAIGDLNGDGNLVVAGAYPYTLRATDTTTHVVLFEAT